MTNFSKLDISLLEKYNALMSDVEAGKIKDFAPYEVLCEFMRENFATKENPESFWDDPRAMLFYHTIGEKWFSEFGDKLNFRAIQRLNKQNLPINNIVKIELDKPGLSIASVHSEQSNKSIELTEEKYHEYGFSELEASLFDDYRSLLQDVESGNLIDFDPDWHLDHFMKENFDSPDKPGSYKQDEKALLFYHRIGKPWLEIFADEQNELLSSK